MMDKKFENFRQFLLYIEDKYEEEQQLIIEDFMSYYINEYNGHGKQNCKRIYQDNLFRDTTGEIHRLALIGFEFEKKREDERRLKKSMNKAMTK